MTESENRYQSERRLVSVFQIADSSRAFRGWRVAGILDVLGIGSLPGFRRAGVKCSDPRELLHAGLSYETKADGRVQSGTNAEAFAEVWGGTVRRPFTPEGILRKEVIQPQVPLRLPCYDLVPITEDTFGTCIPCGFAQRLRVPPAFVA